MSTQTQRVKDTAWQSWTTWCRLNGHEPLGAHTALHEYLRWLVDPYGSGLSAASAYQAYWAVRANLLAARWRDPARDAPVRDALREIRNDDMLARPRRAKRVLTRDEIEAIMVAIPDDSVRGLRDRALIWLGFEGNLRAGQLTDLRWRHVDFHEYQAHVTLIGRCTRDQQVVTLYEQEEPLTAMIAWHGLRRRDPSEPVFASVPWSDRRVSHVPLLPSDVSRIVAKRATGAGLGKANASSLRRIR